ncbi:MAG: hypothetical protein DWQ07_01970 [Chloroflexi bacterium]|nr:MAG: hypothetical protein DWQ07_01970 [Chloroflexota bacterium]MBL1193734.1 M28 family peptidase [Chloroflexota bacterium]NOH11027.1 M28 family peptidase [Chloroflexota bacterium]
MPDRHRSLLVFAVLVIVVVSATVFFVVPINTAEPTPTVDLPPDFGAFFDGARALGDVAHQVSLGPRPTGSEAHAQMIDWMVTTLTEIEGWEVEVQRAEYMGVEVANVVAKRGSGEPWIILGAHYDTRLFADSDPDSANHMEPVLGANDGGSGVAVLMELARVLPRDLDKEIWLVFFDAEDNGRIEGWEWIMGSSAFVEGLEAHPDMAVIVDMIGDADLNVYYELNSDTELREEIWAVAGELGYEDRIIPEGKHSILDDHLPFIWAGIPAVDMIDFDYPYWHTVEDTLDKVSAESLQVIGDTLMAWLETK